MIDISTQVKDLIKIQLQDWPLAKNNYQDLQNVKTRNLVLSGGSTIVVQFNPERMVSSAAKVDAKSIQERICFLCADNRPSQQQEIAYGEEYSILINPFPIFPAHLTIPHNAHILQLIAPYFDTMLSLSKELEDFTLFYNGPKCGASAPDHFHFQAGIKGFMPIEEDFRSRKYAHLVAQESGVELFNWKGYNRGVVTLKGVGAEDVNKLFRKLYRHLQSTQREELEPMLNVLVYFEDGHWIVHVFPRILHRPSCYFAQGNDQLLISPASVDLGGVFITPRQEDFEKLTADDVAEILKQVSLSEEKCELAIRGLMEQS